MEPQSEGNADISANSCTAHTGVIITVEVTSWKGERGRTLSFWCCEEAKRRTQVCVCLVAADDSGNEYQCEDNYHSAVYALGSARCRNSQREVEAWKTRLQSVTHFMFLTILQCLPPSENGNAQTHAVTHMHTSAPRAGCSWCASSAELLLTPAAYCGVSAVSLPSQKLSHVWHCGSALQQARSDAQERHRKLEHT